MKKTLMTFGLMLISVVMLTGCSSNERTLSCVLEEDGMKITVDSTFRNDELRTIKMISEVSFGDETIEEEDYAFIEMMFAAACDEFDFEGVECSTDITASSATVTVEVNVARASDEAVDALNFPDDLTYDEIRADLVGDGFVCR